MGFDLSELATLDHTIKNLDDLISACRLRGRFHQHDLALTSGAARKAMSLRTTLMALKEALADPDHQPAQESPRKEPLAHRIYSHAHLTELVRAVSYGGMRQDDYYEKCKELQARHGEELVTEAMEELVEWDRTGERMVLRPQVRKLASGLLGPAPESPGYAEYYRINRRQPPAEHLPPRTRGEQERGR